MTVEFAGARWWSFDFHAHTPASSDFGRGPDQTRLMGTSPDEWLLAFMGSGIDCVAVTDHNSGAWIDRLKGALEDLRRRQPEGYRPLWLFPGVEITANGGIHVLAIFDGDATGSDIDSLCGAVGYYGTKGKSERAADMSVIDVLAKIRAAGALGILAHAEGPSGAFGMSGNTLRPILASDDLVAVEIADGSLPKHALYIESTRTFAEVLGSDSHHIAGGPGHRFPGSHFTWMKMEQPTLEGLHLALMDGAPLSVRRSDTFPEDQNRTPDKMIQAMEIWNARTMGRGTPLRAAFSPWFTAIVGGRGSGKSSLLEMIRIGLSREDELPALLRQDFDDFKRLPANRGEKGMLQDSTHLTLDYRKNGATYRVRWAQGDEASTISELQSDGSWNESPGVVRSRFPVRMFSQKQIFTMAERGDALLRVIDEAEEVAGAEWRDLWHREQSHYMSLMARSRELGSQAAQRERIRGDLEDVMRKLAVFEQAGHADVLRRYQKRQRQKQSVENWRARLSDAKSALEKLRDDLSSTPPNPEDDFPIPRDAAEAAAVSLLEDLGRHLTALADQVGATADGALEMGRKWDEAVKASAWAEELTSATRAHADLAEALVAEGVGSPNEYASLVARRQELEKALAETNRIETEKDAVVREADEVMTDLLDMRQVLTDRRRQFLAAVVKDNPYVAVQVRPYQPETPIMEAALRTVLNRETGFDDDILVEEAGRPEGGLVGRLLSPTAGDFDDRRRAMEERLAEIKRLIADANRTGAAQGLSGRFVNSLKRLAPEQIDHLMTWFPEDGLEVQYSPEGNGRNLRPIEHASPGQKTAAVLAFLLAYGDEPLILDQPEDDLDTGLIYDLIVKQIREIKVRRQVVVVTHNPNIVVNGDAEMVLEMAFRSGQCGIGRQGSLQSDAIRAGICRLMEGGPEAFKKRYQRIVLGRG